MAVFGWCAIFSALLMFTPLLMKKVKTTGEIAMH
jgi:hypothetical protein